MSDFLDLNTSASHLLLLISNLLPLIYLIFLTKRV